MRVRVKILEYIEEKRAGRYGGSKQQLRRFADHMNQLAMIKGREPTRDRTHEERDRL
jgi:hypothetical protein